jgi:hypothetical protein
MTFDEFFYCLFLLFDLMMIVLYYKKLHSFAFLVEIILFLLYETTRQFRRIFFLRFDRDSIIVIMWPYRL